MHKRPSAIRFIALFALAGLVVGLAAGCGGSAAPATSAPSQPSPADGAALLQERCSSCHSLSKATNEAHTQAEWEQIVSTMIGKGAILTDSEKDVLVEYLAANHGK
ncbi:MAG TPA: cytochrome c [Anaerolineae bacterium]|nr:cytochrome c [Anaerolineae bacterium]